MRKKITYEKIHPLVQHVEIVSDMVQCHFKCPVKSKKIVAITNLFKAPIVVESYQEKGFARNTISRVKNYLFKEKKVEEESFEIEKETAIVHAFGKISERFTWSDEHNHFIYRF